MTQTLIETNELVVAVSQKARNTPKKYSILLLYLTISHHLHTTYHGISFDFASTLSAQHFSATHDPSRSEKEVSEPSSETSVDFPAASKLTVRLKM